jgi:hypothetical protein
MNHLLLSRRIALLVALSLTATGCELIGDIFQAGLVVGIIIILLILAIVGWIIGKFRGRG